MSQAQPRSQQFNRTYETRPNDYNSAQSALRNARNISLWQRVDDVSIGTGIDYATGEKYNMTIPVPLDSFYSNEFGGREGQTTGRDWMSLKKELILRGWDYNGKIYSKATKEGREFEEEVLKNFATIEAAINFYFDPHRPDMQVRQVTPKWAYGTLFTTIAFVVLFLLSIRPYL